MQWICVVLGSLIEQLAFETLVLHIRPSGSIPLPLLEWKGDPEGPGYVRFASRIRFLLRLCYARSFCRTPEVKLVNSWFPWGGKAGGVGGADGAGRGVRRAVRPGPEMRPVRVAAGKGR